MKALLLGAGLFCLMILLTMDSCSEITSDPCDDTMMKNPDEPTIYLKLYIEENEGPDSYHLTHNADKAVYTGTITKYYCGDKKSGSFEFTHTLFLSKDYTADYLRKGVFLQQPYTFKFANDADYLLVTTQMKLFFKDGKIFQFKYAMLSDRFEYIDIGYDVNRMCKYIELYLDRGWVEVTSK